MQLGCGDPSSDMSAPVVPERGPLICISPNIQYEGWNFNFGNTPLDWIQELLE